MKHRGAAAEAALLGLLCLVSGAACAFEPVAQGNRLQLSPLPVDIAAPAPALQHRRPLANPRQIERAVQKRAELRERALENFLVNADAGPEREAMAGEPDASFRFERKGSAVRDVSRGYKAMCDNLSRKLWDEPNGKRIKFDVAGKPGIGVEIPLR